MKSPFQDQIDRLKSSPEQRLSARDLTERCRGEWVRMGVLRCPACGGAEALRAVDRAGGWVQTWCVEGCDQAAVDDAVGRRLTAEGIRFYSRGEED
jgi:hypothetical protein